MFPNVPLYPLSILAIFILKLVVVTDRILPTYMSEYESVFPIPLMGPKLNVTYNFAAVAYVTPNEHVDD